MFCSIPWGHHRYIIGKCKGNPGKAITNFDKQLPVAQRDLANELTKDPYNFDFFTMTEDYNEKELKDAIIFFCNANKMIASRSFLTYNSQYYFITGN